MRQTIAQMRAVARCLGITLHDLIRRRASRTSMVACSDDGTVTIRPKVYCSRELPFHNEVYGTRKS